MRNDVVTALRASGDPIRINTADAIDQGLIELDVLMRHPEPAVHVTEALSTSGTFFFPGTDLNTVMQGHYSVAGAASVSGAPANRIYVLVRRHFSDPAPTNPAIFFRRIVHEAQHYLDHHPMRVAPAAPSTVEYSICGAGTRQSSMPIGQTAATTIIQ